MGWTGRSQIPIDAKLPQAESDRCQNRNNAATFPSVFRSVCRGRADCVYGRAFPVETVLGVERPRGRRSFVEQTNQTAAGDFVQRIAA